MADVALADAQALLDQRDRRIRRAVPAGGLAVPGAVPPGMARPGSGAWPAAALPAAGPLPVPGPWLPTEAASAASPPEPRSAEVLAPAPAAASAAGPAGRTGGEEAMPALIGLVMSSSVPRAPIAWLPA